MTTNDTHREKIARTIRALQAKTVENGCTEQEAMLAAAKAGELMASYRLSQSDIELQAEPIEQRIVKRRQQQKSVVEDNCLGAINRYAGVKCWFTGMPRVVIFFGWRADTELAEWLYKMIGTTIMAEAEKYKRTTRGDASSVAERLQAVRSFRRGMAHRISERLMELAREMEPVAKTGSGTALVVKRTALVDDAYGKLGLNLRKGKTSKFRYGNAYDQGRVAGDRVSLHRPVGGNIKGYLK